MAIPLINFKKLPDATGVASNTVATAQIPSIGTIYALRYRFLTAAGVELTVATIKTECTRIVVRMDSKILIDSTPTFLFDRQLYYGGSTGWTNTNGIVPYDFARSQLLFPAEKMQLALGTNNIGQMTVEFTMGAAITTAKIEVHALMTYESRPAGPHIRLHKFPQNFGTTGDQEVTTLPRDPGTGYYALFIEKSTGTIDKVTVYVDGNEVLDQVPTLVNTNVQAQYYRSAQAAYYVVDFGLNDEALNFLKMDKGTPGAPQTVQDFRVKITWSGAAPVNYNIHTERIFDLDKAVFTQ